MRKVTLKSVKQGLSAFLGLCREIWSDPFARQIILWLLTKRLPKMSVLAGTAAKAGYGTIPRAPKRMTIEEGLAEAKRLGLRCPSCMKALTAAQMDAEWNGMGPDSWAGWLREMIDNVAAFIMICSLPHDMSFVFQNDGSYAGWCQTQADWEYNSDLCLADAAKTAGWWQRKRQAFVAALVVDALRAGAYAAWRKAYCRKAVGDLAQ